MKYLLISLLISQSLFGQVLIDHYRFGASGENNGLLNSLLAFYEFDEASGNALDSSANARHLTESGTVEPDADAVLGSSRYHTRAEDDDYFSAADAAWQEFGTNDFTVAFWWRPMPDADFPDQISDAVLVCKADSNVGNSWLITIDRGSYTYGHAFKFYYDEDGSTGAVPLELLSLEVDENFASDHWYFIYVKREGLDFTMGYAEINDAVITLTDTANQLINFFDTDEGLMVGSWTAGTSVITTHDTEGPIDRLGLWSVALSQCQINKLFRRLSFGQFDTDACN